jgi:hypothetical protein
VYPGYANASECVAAPEEFGVLSLTSSELVDDI